VDRAVTGHLDHSRVILEESTRRDRLLDDIGERL
jgi:hypothetical protein